MKLSPAWTAVISLVPVLVLITLLAINIGIFGSDAILGASQVALLASSGVCVLLASIFFKTPWKEFEKAIGRNFSDIAGATLILFLIGGVSGTWTMSGVVPTFIYYGVKIISPKVFLLSACVICAVISVMTGSSWTTIATIGVALLGIGRAEGFSDGMIAGAIISGAYFGDKISPLSDTTVMASSVNKVPLFTHIRYMFFTTVPSIVITLIIFTVLGLSHSGSEASQIDLYTTVLADKFHITPWLFLVPVVTLALIWKRMPALPVLAISVLAAAVAACGHRRESHRRLPRPRPPRRHGGEHLQHAVPGNGPPGSGRPPGHPRHAGNAQHGVPDSLRDVLRGLHAGQRDDRPARPAAEPLHPCRPAA